MSLVVRARTRFGHAPAVDGLRSADGEPATNGTGTGTGTGENVSAVYSGRAAYLQEFWTLYFRLGFFVLGGESTVGVVYFLLTRDSPHRALLVVIASASALLAFGTLPFVSVFASRTWRVNFSFIWTVLSGAILAVCAHLDGGVNSPLLELATLPVISAALALPAWAVATGGISTIAEIVLVAIFDPRTSGSAPQVTVLFGFTVGIVILAVASSINRTRLENKEADVMRRLSAMAETDPLTGARNHREFDVILRNEIERSLRYTSPLSVIIADVDLFKKFNDTNGHSAGDTALVRVAKVLTDAVRGTDVVARIGGDEFAIILPMTPLDQAVQAADRILATVKADTSIGVTLSIGVSELDPEEPTPIRLFRDADSALYSAKSRGRKTVVQMKTNRAAS